MKQTELKRGQALKAHGTFQASPEQREKCREEPCARCSRTIGCDAAHVVHRSRGGCEHSDCVIPLCRECHRAWHNGEFELLPILEPAFRREQAHAVMHSGIGTVYRMLTRDQMEFEGRAGL